ncbi:hypothetical protein LJR129_004957 [Acidovorax sp. LjRoot129]|uniref:hypothetical protein n=1 Tax=unclassified Acidovorax TaxID=2684926 RepID=UPI003ECF0C19
MTKAREATRNAVRKLSEPQHLLVSKIREGATLQHHSDTGLFRLRDGVTTRSVPPATVESLLRNGVLQKSLAGVCGLA